MNKENDDESRDDENIKIRHVKVRKVREGGENKRTDIIK